MCFYYTIATHYRLDGMGIASLLAQNFQQLIILALGTMQAPI